jgi:rod shape-determining protein MreC
VFIIGFALFLLSSNFGRQHDWNPAESLIVEITGPFQKVVMHAIRSTKRLWFDYFYHVNLRQEDRQLRQRIDTLEMEISRYQELLLSYDRLQELLQFKQTVNRPALAAQVIGLDPTGWFKSIIVDKGENSGIQLDMPVVNGRGVVGRIVSISSNYAKALLIIDQNSGVDALVQRSRDRGVLKGLSTEACTLNYVVKSSDVQVDDMVVTSGLGGVFPRGLPLGKIVEVRELTGELFNEILVRPSVDFSKLEEVLVILKGQEP